MAASSSSEISVSRREASPANSRCVVLVPVADRIEPPCEESLRLLEARGYPVWRVRGYSQVDTARCQLATEALEQGFDELLWIDSDIGFDPNDVERLREHRLPIVCGLYAKKGPREFACSFLDETESVLFGKAGGLTQIRYAGFGFALTRRAAYEQIRQQQNLPVCNLQFGKPLVPYFMPLVAEAGSGAWYLGEDYAFCHRARASGIPIWADTTIRLWHVGSYRYGWEDAGADKQRFGSYRFQLPGRPVPDGERIEEQGAQTGPSEAALTAIFS
jgi:hypothetical protein